MLATRRFTCRWLLRKLPSSVLQENPSNILQASCRHALTLPQRAQSIGCTNKAWLQRDQRSLEELNANALVECTSFAVRGAVYRSQ